MRQRRGGWWPGSPGRIPPYVATLLLDARPARVCSCRNPLTGSFAEDTAPTSMSHAIPRRRRTISPRAVRPGRTTSHVAHSA